MFFQLLSQLRFDGKVAVADAREVEDFAGDSETFRFFVFVRTVDHFGNFFGGQQFGAFVAGEESGVAAGSGEGGVRLQNGVGLGVHHIPVLLEFQTHPGVFAPGQLAFINARHKAVVAHADLVVVFVGENTAHLGGRVFAFKSGQHRLEHKIFVPVERGSGGNKIDGRIWQGDFTVHVDPWSYPVFSFVKDALAGAEGAAHFGDSG